MLKTRESASIRSARPVNFTALTLNMQNGQVWDHRDPDSTPLRIGDTIDFLRECGADVIFLQEVEVGYDGGHQADPPPNYSALKAALTGYDSVFSYPRKNPDELPFGLGLAIFSRTPLTGFQRLDLPPADVTFEFGGRLRKPSWRLLIEAESVMDGRGIRLMNTHLQAFFMINATSDDHRGQRNLVQARVLERSIPTVLAGDFNCAPGETLLEQFAASGMRTAQGTEATWRRRPYVLDHLLYNSLLTRVDARVLPTLASDHHAVEATFAFIETPEGASTEG